MCIKIYSMKPKCPKCKQEAEFTSKDIYGEDSSCIWNLLYCDECGHILQQTHIIIEKDFKKIATKNFERHTEKTTLVSLFEDSSEKEYEDSTANIMKVKEADLSTEEKKKLEKVSKASRVTFLTSQELKNDTIAKANSKVNKFKPNSKGKKTPQRSISNEAEISEEEKTKPVFSMSFLDKQEVPPFFQLDKAKVIRPLSGGGMAETYLYESHFEGHDQVVVKIVKANDQFFERFKREVRVHSSLQHRNIIKTLEAGARSKFVYLITEYADGGDLQALINRKGKLGIRTALGISMSIANALNYGWKEKALVHRDVKPANILLDKTSKIVKLSDFGLAKFVDEVNEESKITYTGISLGTPCFCSPEQINKFRDVEYLSDIYSIGSVLYHMITGLPPYADKLKEHGISYFFDKKLEPEKLQFREIPTGLRNIICACMQYEPEDRYQNYEDLIEDMKNFYLLC